MRTSSVLVLSLLAACGDAPLDATATPDALPTEEAAPPPFGLRLTTVPAMEGQTWEAAIDDATPGAAVVMAVGAPGLRCPPSWNGTCMDLASGARVVQQAFADADGRAAVVLQLPPSVTAGRTFRAQAAELTGGTPVFSPPIDHVVEPLCLVPGTYLAEGCNWFPNPQFHEWAEPVVGTPPFAVATHDPTVDVDGDPTSGSLRVENQTDNAFAVAGPCSAAAPGLSYDVATRAFLDGSTAGSTTTTYLGIYFYSSTDCSGTPTASNSTAAGGSVTDQWVTLQLFGTEAPTTALSVKVGAGIVPAAGTSGSVAWFDDVWTGVYF